MDRHIWIRSAEIVLLLPATAFLAPMAAASALGMMFAIVQDARFGLVAELMLIRLMALFTAAALHCQPRRTLTTDSGDQKIAPMVPQTPALWQGQSWLAWSCPANSVLSPLGLGHTERLRVPARSVSGHGFSSAFSQMTSLQLHPQAECCTALFRMGDDI